MAFKIGIPEDSIDFFDKQSLPPEWHRHLGLTREIGDDWLTTARTIALAVPSAILPESSNLLLNPLHPRAAEIQILHQQPFRFDPRLRP